MNQYRPSTISDGQQYPITQRLITTAVHCTCIPSIRAQRKSLAVRPYPEGPHLLGGSVGHRGAPWPTIEPQNERPWWGASVSGGLYQPVKQSPACLWVHGNVARILRKVHVCWLPGQLDDPVPLLLFKLIISSRHRRWRQQHTSKTQNTKLQREGTTFFVLVSHERLFTLTSLG
jgi:hypothetical protein